MFIPQCFCCLRFVVSEQSMRLGFKGDSLWYLRKYDRTVFDLFWIQILLLIRWPVHYYRPTAFILFHLSQIKHATNRKIRSLVTTRKKCFVSSKMTLRIQCLSQWYSTVIVKGLCNKFKWETLQQRHSHRRYFCDVSVCAKPSFSRHDQVNKGNKFCFVRHHRTKKFRREREPASGRLIKCSFERWWKKQHFDYWNNYLLYNSRKCDTLK